jgi:hypothetical protein
MSTISLEAVKGDLRVTHDADDALLQTLLEASEDEASRFLGVSGLDPDALGGGDGLPPSIHAAVFLLVRAKYETVDPTDIRKLRDCAEMLLMPHRVNLGV